MYSHVKYNMWYLRMDNETFQLVVPKVSHFIA